MPYEPETPFDSIEGALEYVSLLVESVQEAREDIAAELAEARSEADAARRADALQLVAYKLDRLSEQIERLGFAQTNHFQWFDRGRRQNSVPSAPGRAESSGPQSVHLQHGDHLPPPGAPHGRR